MLKFNKNKINYREEKFGGLIINIKTGKIFKLNKTGYKVFLVLLRGIEIKKLIKNLSKKFEAEKKEIRRDVKYFINDLIKEGFVSKNSQQNKKK